MMKFWTNVLAEKLKTCFAAVLLSTFLATFTVPQAIAFTESEQADIEAIIHNYLIENPEILEDMIASLRAKEARQRVENSKVEIARNYDAIFYPGPAFVAGNPKGDVTLVEFFDYTCSFCKKALADVRNLIASDKNLRVVFIDYPALAERNPTSMIATRASVAAANQGKNIALHMKMMGATSQLTSKAIMGFADEVDLDIEQLLEDMNANETYARIDANIALAHRLGIDGTPSFVIGDQVIVGAQGHAVLKRAIDVARANKK